VAGSRIAGVLVVACVVALGTWWARRAAAERALGVALSDYAAAPFPEAGDPVDDALADLGADVFQRRCSACHVVSGEAKLGPNLAGVTRRRDLTWIRSMILRPDSMTAADPVASALKAQYGVQMLVTGDFTPAHVRAVVEFLRRADGA
jgi:mono/diheme cytochrome c family protein